LQKNSAVNIDSKGFVWMHKESERKE